MDTTSSPSARVSSKLRGAAAERGVSNLAISEAIGRTPMWVSRRMRNLSPLTIDDLVLIAGTVDLDPAQVLADALGSSPAEASA